MTKLKKIHLDKRLICSKLVGTLGCLTKVLKQYFYEFDSQSLVKITIYSTSFSSTGFGLQKLRQN